MLSLLFPESSATDTTTQWLIKQPIFVAFALFNYLYFVLKCGPDFMRNRPAYELRLVMLAYNAIQVVVNIWLAVYAFRGIYDQDGYMIKCIYPSEWTTLAHFYYVYNKYLDLLDTVIFVLRKKQNQITFLHVYHHCAVIVFPTCTFYVYPGSMVSMIVVANCAVHTLMYSYYYLMIYSSETRAKYEHWKKTLTQIQLVQFVLIVAQFVRPLVGNCADYPKSIGWLVVSTNGLFFFMFANFYRNTYLRKKKKVSTK